MVMPAATLDCQDHFGLHQFLTTKIEVSVDESRCYPVNQPDLQDRGEQAGAMSYRNSVGVAARVELVSSAFEVAAHGMFGETQNSRAGAGAYTTTFSNLFA
jgi:hypothetical protein